MTEKKVELDAETKKRLAALLKKEEAAWGEASDEQLDALEAEQKQRIQALVKDKSPGKGEQENWEAIQRRIEANNAKQVISLAARRQKLIWPAFGVISAAALALLVLYPRQGFEQHDQGVLMKGTGDAPAFSASCEIELRTNDSLSEEILPGPQGYSVSQGQAFVLSYKCDRPGFIHVWVKGGTSIINQAVHAGDRGGLHDGPRLASFTLEGDELKLHVAVTSEPIANPEILHADPESASWGQKLIWADSLHIKRK